MSCDVLQNGPWSEFFASNFITHSESAKAMHCDSLLLFEKTCYYGSSKSAVKQNFLKSIGDKALISCKNFTTKSNFDALFAVLYFVTKIAVSCQNFWFPRATPSTGDQQEVTVASDKGYCACVPLRAEILQHTFSRAFCGNDILITTFA